MRPAIANVRKALFVGFLLSTVLMPYLFSFTASGAIIFSDGFESGNLTSWTGNLTTAGCVLTPNDTSNPFSGTYNLKADIDAGTAADEGTYAVKNLTATKEHATIQARNVQANATNDGSAEGTNIFGFWQGYLGTGWAFAGMGRLSSANKWLIKCRNDSSYIYVWSSTTWTVDTNYAVEFEVQRSTSGNRDGYCLLYVDGSLVVNASNLDNDDRTIMYVSVGNLQTHAQAAPIAVKLDAITVADSYIGLDSTPPTFASLSSSTTVAGASCTIHSTWTDETGLITTGGYILGHNGTSTFTNSSWAAFVSNPQTTSGTITLNHTMYFGSIVQWCIYANDTSNNWNSTGLQSITLTNPDFATTSYVWAAVLLVIGFVFMGFMLSRRGN